MLLGISKTVFALCVDISMYLCTHFNKSLQLFHIFLTKCKELSGASRLLHKTICVRSRSRFGEEICDGKYAFHTQYSTVFVMFSFCYAG